MLHFPSEFLRNIYSLLTQKHSLLFEECRVSATANRKPPSAKAQAAFERATEMGSMPVLAKAVLFVGTLAMSGSAYLLMFLSSECFEDFALTDQIEDVLCLDCPRAAIKPKGFLALGMLSVGVLCMIGFKQWAAARVKRQATAMV